MTSVELLILGSGTSQGVPAIGCRCATCTSADPRDRRLRPSVLFRVSGKAILVDLSSDFRQQMLVHSIPRLDGILLTHHHFDHIGGFDDLRQYNYLQREAMIIHGLPDTLAELRTTFRYAFDTRLQEGGGVPEADLRAVQPGKTFTLAGLDIIPVPALHGALPVLGYRIGPVAYLTDISAIGSDGMTLLDGLEVLVLDALRHAPHPTHLHLDAAISLARNIGARRTWFTHIAHDILHERDTALLPPAMEFAHDGLVVSSGGGRS